MFQNMLIKYSIIIPVYNAEKTLKELHQQIIQAMMPLQTPFEVIFIDDCSQDLSWKILNNLALKDNRVTAIQLLKNSGQGSATLAGFEQAKGEFIITMDDDLQHPPEELPQLINAIEQDDSTDVVIGFAGVVKQPLFRRIGSNLINRINNWFLKKDPKIRMSSFRIIRPQVAAAMLSMNIYYPSLGPMILSVTNRLKNITIKHAKRSRGKSGYTIPKLLKQSFSNIIGYSVLPLHMLAVIGALGIFLCFCLTIHLFISYFFIGIKVPGWMTILLVIMMFSSFNFFAFSLIGEYVLRITQSSTKPRQWIIRHITVGSNSKQNANLEKEQLENLDA